MVLVLAHAACDKPRFSAYFAFQSNQNSGILDLKIDFAGAPIIAASFR
jgi:hypothetical protein